MLQKVLNRFSPYKWPLAIFLIGRFGIFVLAYAGLALIQEYAPDRTTWELFGDNRWLNGWARWDAGWYKDIADSGYALAPRFDEQRNVVFFPLYPLMIRAFRLVTQHTGVAGLLVSNLSFVAALLLLFSLVKSLYSIETAKLTLVFVTVFPFSFYFSALYAEALFFALVVASFFFAHRSQWALAAFCAALAGATRVAGITLLLGLGVLYFEQIDFQVRRIRADILWLLIVPLGVVAYALYLGNRFDAPLIFATARAVDVWSHDFGEAIRTLSYQALLTGNFQMMHLFNLLISVASILLVLLCWRKLPKAYVIWSLAYFILSAFGNWFNLGRYMIPAFPIYIAAALLFTRSETIYVIVYLSTLALALLTILYTHWYWVS
jgi:hypothetical protein